MFKSKLLAKKESKNLEKAAIEVIRKTKLPPTDEQKSRAFRLSKKCSIIKKVFSGIQLSEEEEALRKNIFRK